MSLNVAVTQSAAGGFARKGLPDNAIPITTYAHLDSFADEFAQGAYDLVGVIGDRGIGKSRAFSERLPKDQRCLISGGSNTPFQVYLQLHDHRDQTTVFDDADDLWLSPKARPMMKQFCETDPKHGPRMVTYRSREVERLGLPTEFLTSSRVVIVCNVWPKGLDAVADRGIMLDFHPSVFEVHERVRNGGWFNDAEVMEFFEQHLHLVTAPSMRNYLHAHDMRLAGRQDWREHTLLMIQPDKRRGEAVALVSTLLQDQSISQAAKVQRFKDETGLSQPTYYRLLEKLKRAQGN